MPLTTRTVSATEAKTIKATAEAKSLEDNAAKGGQLPLHYAAKKGASLNVVKLLLKANPGAATAVDGARCSAQAVLRIHISPPSLPPHRRVRHLSRDIVQSPSDTNTTPHASYAGGRAALTLRCRQQGRAVRCGEAAARRQPRGCRCCGSGAPQSPHDDDHAVLMPRRARRRLAETKAAHALRCHNRRLF